MRRVVMAAVVISGILLLGEHADAQYRYTDDKGKSKVTQYKIAVPAAHRDAAVWIGPTGIGKPGLSEAQRQARQRDNAYRRIGERTGALMGPFRQWPDLRLRQQH